MLKTFCHMLAVSVLAQLAFAGTAMAQDPVTQAKANRALQAACESSASIGASQACPKAVTAAQALIDNSRANIPLKISARMNQMNALSHAAIEHEKVFDARGACKFTRQSGTYAALLRTELTAAKSTGQLDMLSDAQLSGIFDQIDTVLSVARSCTP